MKIKILGTRGEIKESGPYHARHSGVLIDNTLLFDLGEQEFLTYRPKAIFITHLHPDHAYFVRDGEVPPKIKVPIYAPEMYPGIPINKLRKKIIIAGYTITPIPTQHSVKVVSQAYLIEKENERILYSGDMFWIKKQYHSKLRNLTMVITDGSFMRTGGMIRRDKIHNLPYGHAGIPDLIHLFAPYTNTIVFIHFGSWFYRVGAAKARQQLKQLGREYDVDVLTGYDGMELNVHS